MTISVTQSVLHGEEASGAFTLPWSTWRQRPAAGDLVFILVSAGEPGMKVNGPHGWQSNGGCLFWKFYDPHDADPVFTAAGSSGRWLAEGFIAYGAQAFSFSESSSKASVTVPAEEHWLGLGDGQQHRRGSAADH